MEKNKNSFAFVIMPFDKEFNDIYKLGIKAAAKSANVKAERLDEQMYGEGMLERIYRQIDGADIVVADLSKRNSNVFYELGYAHAKEKLCILLTKSVDDIPFDLKHKRHIVYGDSISYLKSELTENLKWAAKKVANRKKSKLAVITKEPSGHLSNTEHSSEAVINLTFDLHNKTEQLSPEITAVYLYTGNKWNVIFEGKECAFSDADIEPFKRRYSVPTANKRLGNNGWYQIKIKATRIIASAWRGEQIPSEYNVGGRGILRLETTEGNFDHEFDFNILLEDIPF